MTNASMSIPSKFLQDFNILSPKFILQRNIYWIIVAILGRVITEIFKLLHHNARHHQI